MVKLGTLTRAAEALYLSQPTISLLLQALERELGVRLLERRRRRINLTDAGEALYELARPLVEGWENLDRDFQAKVKGLHAGRLTIAAGTSTIQYLLPEWVRRYRELYPAVQLQLANVTGKDGLALLRADTADFAVGSMLDVPNDIAWAPVRSYDPMLITPLDHPLASRSPHHAGGSVAVRPDPAAAAAIDLPAGGSGVPATPGAVSGGDRGRRLGRDQGIRGDGAGHLDRHRHLHHRGRPRPAGDPQHAPVFPAAQLRRGDAQGQVAQSRGAGIRRSDPPRVCCAATTTSPGIPGAERFGSDRKGDQLPASIAAILAMCDWAVSRTTSLSASGSLPCQCRSGCGSSCRKRLGWLLCTSP